MKTITRPIAWQEPQAEGDWQIPATYDTAGDEDD